MNFSLSLVIVFVAYAYEFECRVLVFSVALFCWSYLPDYDCRKDAGQEHR
jgi:hypothetical protein